MIMDIVWKACFAHIPIRMTNGDWIFRKPYIKITEEYFYFSGDCDYKTVLKTQDVVQAMVTYYEKSKECK